MTSKLEYVWRAKESKALAIVCDAKKQGITTENFKIDQ
jgi:hypothetical protein